MLQSRAMRTPIGMSAILKGLLLACGLGSVSVAGCVGPRGPELPLNVGTSHPPSERQRARRAEAEEPAEPVPVGTVVWANFHDTGFYFHAVVVDRREAMHRVVYADGAHEWLPAASLLPDSLREDAQVHVRSSYEGEFSGGLVLQRLGTALYVRFAGGDERWTALPHVRFAHGAPGTPRRGEDPYVPSAQHGEPGSDLLVNYQFQGLRFAGTVTARGEDGRAHVVYLDGESEWTPQITLGPDDLSEGAAVHVRRSWEPPVWAPARIQARVGPAVRVRLDDGGEAWTSLFRIRAPVPEQARPAGPEPEAEPSPEPEAAPTERRGRPRRARPR
jgi:hypothetical protein